MVADLLGDGQQTIVVGFAGNALSQVTAYDRNLQRLWTATPVYHSAGRVDAADLDGDGRQEILVSDHYASVHIISAEGRYLARTLSDMTETCFDVGDINGDGKLELLHACDGGVLKAFAYPVAPLFTFANYGYAIRAVRALDLDGDGRAEVVVASDTGYLYVLDGSGETRQQYDLGSDILAMAVSAPAEAAPAQRGDLRLVVGQRDGGVRLLDPGGRTTASYGLDRPVKLLRCLDTDGDGRRVRVAVDSTNRCLVLGDER